jgi:hypothetical protein
MQKETRTPVGLRIVPFGSSRGDSTDCWSPGGFQRPTLPATLPADIFQTWTRTHGSAVTGQQFMTI